MCGVVVCVVWLCVCVWCGCVCVCLCVCVCACTVVKLEVDRIILLPCSQLSELRLGSQAPGFTLKDLPLGPCTCVPLLERYKEDLELARGEIAERTRQLEAASKSLALLNEEHGKTLEKLAKSQAMFQKISHEQKFFQGEVNKYGSDEKGKW